MTGTTMTVRADVTPGRSAHPLSVVSPAPRDIWRDLLRSDREALAFQSPEWIDLICAAGPYADASRLYELPDGRHALLPLIRRRWLPRWAAVVESPPSGWGYGGLVAPDPLDAGDLALIFDDLARRPGLRTAVRPNPRQAALWEAARPVGALAIPSTAHVVDLSGGVDQVWSGFRSEARRMIRRADRLGLVVECGSSERLVKVFYDLFLKSVDRWAEQQREPLVLARLRARRRDPLAKFQHIAAGLGPACQIWVAWVDGQPAATTLVVRGNNASYTRGAMDKALAGPSHANDLLHWLAIKDAIEAGCRFYHMGESGTSASLSRYKERFGARQLAFSQYYVERLPITTANRWGRQVVKRLIGFRDTGNQ